jgi:hypothetical protein
LSEKDYNISEQYLTAAGKKRERKSESDSKRKDTTDHYKKR